jgi:hypothetical protein
VGFRVWLSLIQPYKELVYKVALVCQGKSVGTQLTLRIGQARKRAASAVADWVSWADWIRWRGNETPEARNSEAWRRLLRFGSATTTRFPNTRLPATLACISSLLIGVRTSYAGKWVTE